jgi:ABC-2 type transport system ATP-binding protein
MTAAITIDRLSKRYGSVTALQDLSLEVPAGSIFGFLGPNGAGKTTALKILAGLIRATDGAATVNGIPVDVAGAHRGEVGYLAQEPRFYGWMSGRQTLEYVARYFPRPASPRRVAALLDLVGLTDAADRPTKSYSGGMRQRLGIAQALAGDPAVVLLDEPVAALDPIGRHDVLALLERLRGDKTVFYSTHILDDVQRVSDRVAILDRGRLVISASTGDLAQRAGAGSLTVALIGADEGTAARLSRLDGVNQVTSGGRTDDAWTYKLETATGRARAVQGEVMRLAAETGLIVAANQQEAVDLESAFLRIVNEERAA